MKMMLKVLKLEYQNIILDLKELNIHIFFKNNQ